MSQTDSSFETTFTPERIALIVAAIKTAVNNASDRYEQTIGCNATTFGTDVYHLGKHELKQLASKHPSLFAYKSQGNLFRLLVDDYELAYHKVGYSVNEGIERSFPNNEGAVIRIVQQAEEQLAFIGEGFDVLPKKKFVLAHFANWEDGMNGLYLCKPKRDMNSIVWDATHELWKQEQNTSKQPMQKTKLPPVEKVGDLKLQPKENIGEISLPPKVEKVTLLDHD